MYGGDFLIIERPGKPYLATKVGMIWMALILKAPDTQTIKDNAKRLYESFEDGKDPNEFTLYSVENTRNDPRCKGDVHLIIPATKDRFLRVADFLAGDMTCKLSIEVEKRIARIGE